MIRIANGQGFWGDWLEAPVRLVDGGPIDYLTLDYLAEVTMSILQKQRQQDPELGYARDFPPLIGRIATRLRERHVKVVANAGGVNPVACARAVLKAAPGLKVAVVLGDDVLGRIDEFLGKGYRMRNIDTGEPLSAIRDRILSANAYIGAFPLADEHVVGPAQIGGQAGDLRDRLLRAQAQSQHHQRQVAGGQWQAQHDRDIQTGAGFRLPGVAMTSDAGHLSVGADDGPCGASVPR